jgi:SAM-dependent methyltransferase
MGFATKMEDVIVISENVNSHSFKSNHFKCDNIIHLALQDGRLMTCPQPLAADLIIVHSGIEMVQEPLMLFRQLWTALKPGGRCVLCFSSNFNAPVGSRPVKMWTTMTDEQKLWVAGSYFQYSACEGWEQLEAYDLHGHSGREALVFDSAVAEASAFVVQARKTAYPELSPATMGHDELAASLRPRLIGLPHLNSADRKFLPLRLAAQLPQNWANTPVAGRDVEQLIAGSIPSLYRVLAGK